MRHAALARDLLASQVSSTGSPSHGRPSQVTPGRWHLQEGCACLLGREALQGSGMMCLQSNGPYSCCTLLLVNMTLHKLLTALSLKGHGVSILLTGVKFHWPGTSGQALKHVFAPVVCVIPTNGIAIQASGLLQADQPSVMPQQMQGQNPAQLPPFATAGQDDPPATCPYWHSATQSQDTSRALEGCCSMHAAQDLSGLHWCLRP